MFHIGIVLINDAKISFFFIYASILQKISIDKFAGAGHLIDEMTIAE